MTVEPTTQPLEIAANPKLNTGHPANLFRGMIHPLIPYRIQGALWYQGENNCHGTSGNSAQKVGYGCMQVALVDLWRREWSRTPARR